jgi:hypothetical protein
MQRRPDYECSGRRSVKRHLSPSDACRSMKRSRHWPCTSQRYRFELAFFPHDRIHSELVPASLDEWVDRVLAGLLSIGHISFSPYRFSFGLCPAR